MFRAVFLTGIHLLLFDMIHMKIRQNGISISCRLKVSEEAMKHWAVEHANIAKVVSPESLVQKIREEIQKANKLYEMD